MYGYDQTPPGQGYQQQGQPGYGQQPPPYGQQYAQQPPPQPPRQGPAGSQQPGPGAAAPAGSQPSLRDAVRDFTSGTMLSEDFQSIFSTSKVYCPRGESPGFLALHETQQPVIPMFTSLKELRRYAGRESRYFVITGAEVLDLLPSGYGFVLDMEGEHRIVFDAKSVEEMVDFAMRRMYY